MHVLYTQELYQALEYARSVDQDSGKRLMIQLEIDQPLLFQTVFNTFPAIITEKNEDLAKVFVDLCFDVVCVYQKAFGSTPKFKDDPTWMERQVGLLDKELKPLMEGRHVNEKRSQRIKEGFFKPKADELQQNGLIQFLNEAVDDGSGEQCDPGAIDLTKAMLFVVVRLFNNLYTKPTLQ
ncbi:MAG: hypothetical protein PHH59_08765 [Methylovulum sp.]|uniref:hypothetical protein n=1 Tax=Methylovulum sp. TaxID=1916980 RepID=UPI0026311CA2|nr:hypothetical protein [Methylovulum sp.]MDD2724094.1 hypothetical protein [Methylovulum sp.]MDD5124720.1 hypothetical protein [Methylovulum sp.]